MPNLDGTGPRGTGMLGLGRAMGRGRGKCFRVLGDSNQAPDAGVRLNELQKKYDRLQYEFETFKAKS